MRLKLENINQWLMIASNIGVLIGIVFLAIEIQQNTAIVQRDVRLATSDALHRTMLENERLPGLMDKIQQIDIQPRPIRELSEAFELTTEEANLWFRYQLLFWRQLEADWILLGRTPNQCDFERQLYVSLDNQIFINSYGQNRMDQGFYECVSSGPD